jgi:TetR/AcrR family transcriptional regulator
MTHTRTIHPSALAAGDRSDERSARTRKAILSAAEEAFAQSGFAGARTEAIAAAAGVNKAMLYYYFKSKSGVYQAVLEEGFREFHERAMEILTGPGPAGEVLLRYVELHFDFMSSHKRCAPLYQQVMSAGGRQLKELVRKYFEPRVQALGQLLERGMQEKSFRKVDRFHTGVSIAAVIVFYFSAANVLKLMGQADPYTPENLRVRRHEIVDFIRHALFRQPEAT